MLYELLLPIRNRLLHGDLLTRWTKPQSWRVYPDVAGLLATTFLLLCLRSLQTDFRSRRERERLCRSCSIAREPRLISALPSSKYS